MIGKILDNENPEDNKPISHTSADILQHLMPWGKQQIITISSTYCLKLSIKSHLLHLLLFQRLRIPFNRLGTVRYKRLSFYNNFISLSRTKLFMSNKAMYYQIKPKCQTKALNEKFKITLLWMKIKPSTNIFTTELWNWFKLHNN